MFRFIDLFLGGWWWGMVSFLLGTTSANSAFFYCIMWCEHQMHFMSTVTCVLFFQLQVFQKEEIEPLQVKQQEVNWLGQGLIQSAAKSTNTENLEHDLEDVNTRWKTLNKKVIILYTILLLSCPIFWLLTYWCLSKHRKLNIQWDYELCCFTQYLQQ